MSNPQENNEIEGFDVEGFQEPNTKIIQEPNTQILDDDDNDGVQEPNTKEP